MPAARPVRRYNRFQRALLLIRHYGKTRLGVPLTGFALLIVGVMSGAILTGVFSYFVSVVLTHLYPGKFILERDFMNVWVPCAIVVGFAAHVRLSSKSDAWEEKLRAAFTNPPPPEINEVLPESEVLVRASDGSASDFLLTPAFAPSDNAPETLLRAANAAPENFPGGEK